MTSEIQVAGVGRAEHELLSAIREGDRVALERLVGATFRHGNSISLAAERETWIEHLLSATWYELSIDKVQSRLVGERVGLAQFEQRWHAHLPKGEVEGLAHVLDVWSHHDGRWELVARQTARVG